MTNDSTKGQLAPYWRFGELLPSTTSLDLDFDPASFLSREFPLWNPAHSALNMVVGGGVFYARCAIASHPLVALGGRPHISPSEGQLMTSMEDREGTIWFDGELVPWRAARLHVLSHTLHHGTGIFEGVRAYNTDAGPAIFRLADHTRRLLRSAHIMQMVLPFDEATLNAAQIAVVRENRLTECYIRPIAFYGGEAVGVSAKGNRVHVAVAAWAWDSYLGKSAQQEGIRVKTSSFSRHHVNSLMIHAKVTGHYVNSVLAHQEAAQQGYQESLMLDSQGFPAEGSTENLFVIRDGVVCTPDCANVLEGITRDSIMNLARDRGIPVVERRVSRDEIYCADEAFFTGTAAEITPIRELDNRRIGNGVPGPLTKALQQDYFATVRGKNARRAEWLHAVESAGG